MLGDFGNPFADGFHDADINGLGGGAFGDFGGELVDGYPDTKKKKKKGKRVHREDLSFDGGFGLAAEADPAGPRPSAPISGWDDGRPTHDVDILGGGVAYLAAVFEADCDFSQRIQAEVTRMDDELRVLRLQCSQLHEEVFSATAEHRLLSEQQQSCESQLQLARHHAGLLRNGRAAGLERAGVTGERALCMDELQSLEELEACSEQELVELNRLNASIQAQVSASEALSLPLEARRREALLEVAAERQRCKQDLLALRRVEADLEHLQGARDVERPHHLRSAFRSAERALAEAEEDTAWWLAPTNPFAGAELKGSPQPPPRPTQFDQIFEELGPVGTPRAAASGHMRRHLAAGRPSSGPLDV